MNLLHLGQPEDQSYLHRLQALTAGTQAAWKVRLSDPLTVREIEDQCAKVPGGVQGIVCTSQFFLEKLLHQQPDFIEPNTRKGITLDDYQGSLLHTPRDKIPVVILNPLANLVSVPWATAAAKRFVSKLTRPDDWYPQTPFTWELATPATVERLYGHFKDKSRIISVDIETPIGDELRRINCVGYGGFFPETGTSHCIVLPATDAYWLAWIRKFNELPQPKIFQGGIYDNLYFLRWGAPVRNYLFDTLNFFHCAWSEFPKRLDFITAYTVRDVRYWKDDGKSGNQEDYYRYNAKDCWATLNSMMALLSMAEPYMLKNYLQEFPLVFPSLHCAAEGLRWDVARAKEVQSKKEIDVLRRESAFVKMIAAPGFNINSPKQVKNLFKVLGVGHLESTDAANMLKAQAAHPLNGRILSELVSIKKEKKLLSTYFVLEKFWNGRLYYKLDPAGTDTGRLASTESSFWCGLQIQNIPRGDSVKQCITSDPGWLLCEIDKEQAEARCVGYLAGETALIDLVEGPHDYHSWNASSFFGVPYEQIYDEAFVKPDGSRGKQLDPGLRDLAKRTNHGANYNMGPWMMLNTMGPKKVAHAKMILKLPSSWSLERVCEYMLDKYEKTYPRIKKDWYDSLIKEVNLSGRLVSPLGWTRIFFGKPSRQNKPLLNAAVAHPPQNLSVSMINIEFYNVWRASVYNSYYTREGVKKEMPLRDRVRLKAQIHDSIFFQYPATDATVPQIVASMMDTRVQVKAPDGVTRELFIPSAISAGKERWSELK